MSNINIEGLPPEMQARIADVIEKAKASAVQPAGSVPVQAPPQQGLVNPGALASRPPSLMDHIIALRGEVADLRQENLDLRQQVHASAQVTEAVGNAVGQMYQMFQAQTEPTSYSSNFQEAQPSLNDDF
jgi:hypothetical protein